MPEEHLTEDLIARLRAAANPQEYLDEGVTMDRTLPDYLADLLAEKNLKRAAVIRSSGVHPTVAYDIFSGKCTHPGRDKMIMLAFGLNCTPARRSACFASQACRSFGPRCVAMPSSRGASITASLARHAMTSCGISARKRFWARGRFADP